MALDVGNSSVKVGAFRGSNLIGRWRLPTVRTYTATDWSILIGDLSSSAIKVEDLEGIVIASVVPALEAPLAAMGERYFGVQTLFITSDTDTGLKVRYDDPSRLGADRLVNGATAFRRYGGPALIIDVGTAINLDRFRGRRVSWRHHLSRNRDVPSVLVREDGTASKRGVLQACEFDWYKYRALH